MKVPRIIQNPAVITGCVLLVSLIISVSWHFVFTTHRAARINSIRRELKARQEFDHVYLVIRGKNSIPQIKGGIASEAVFASLTNLLSNLAPDMPIGIWVEWPIGRDPNREPGSMIGTTVGEWGGTYDRISSNISSTSFYCFAAFLCSFVSTGFWRFWKRVCIEEKPWRNWLLLILTPFFGPAMIALLWWKQPDWKGSSGNQWVVFILILTISFLITTSLFIYCLHSMVKGRHRFLSSLGMFVSGLAALLESLIVARIIVAPFL